MDQNETGDPDQFYSGENAQYLTGVYESFTKSVPIKLFYEEPHEMDPHR
jgi:hypothetical protein